MAYNAYDLENIPNTFKKQNASSPLNRSILADNTNTKNTLVAIPRKRTHFSKDEQSPPASPSKLEGPDLTNKRPKPDPLQSTPNSKTSFLSSIRNTFSIFCNWNPIKARPTNTPPDPPTRPDPLHTPSRPMHPIADPLAVHDPGGTSHCVTGGPTIKPWAFSNLKREQEELSSTLSTYQRESATRSVFNIRKTPDKTIFKNEIFARGQRQRYENLLASKSIPTDILSISKHPSAPSRHNSTLLEASSPPSSHRLSSSLLDPPPLPQPTPVSSNYSRRYKPEFSFRPPSRGPDVTNRFRYNKLSSSKSKKVVTNNSLFTSLETTQVRNTRSNTPPSTPLLSKHTPHPEQDDICIVSVDKPHSRAPFCSFSSSLDKSADPLTYSTHNYIGNIKHQFDLSRIKKEFEEEELNAYNRKMALSYMERHQVATPATANTRTRSYAKANTTSIQELNEKMERLVNTVEIDIGDSGMPGPGFKPVELGEEMENQVSNALIYVPQEEVLSSGFRLHIKRKDMSTLLPEHWLNDEIINFYCSMLAERSQQTANKPLPTVHTFNTFFYPQLKDRGYDNIKRWTRKIDIFTFDIITVPIHLGMHWCMSLIDFRKKTITYYDSFLGSNEKCLNNLFDYLKRERVDKKGEKFDTTDWRLEHEKDIPEQRNSSDCGVFACQFAEFLTRDAPISFVQDDMPLIRRQMVAEILQKKLYH